MPLFCAGKEFFMAISEKILKMKGSSSFIRKMFETGARLKKEFGADNVYDFSLGNPNLLPPKKVTELLLREAVREDMHGYMSNAGYQDVRDRIAALVTKEQQTTVSGIGIVMTSGAGGALNVILKTLLNPGDKVLVSKPCFVEYGFYCENHGGSLEMVPSLPGFDLDIAAFDRAIDNKTAAVIINSPNNPTGKIYPESSIKALADLLERKSAETGRRIYLISDEPYRKIVYDGAVVPSVMKAYPHTAICTSYSKDLSLSGERIGYLAVNPAAESFDDIMDGAILCNRILGYVNAPSLMQRVVAELPGLSVDVDVYKRNRDRLVPLFQELGFRLDVPEGAFYLFPEAPGGDDLRCVDILQSENILAVPGRGFGAPGYLRFAYCVSGEMIERSVPAFRRAALKLFEMP
jgi:aspartate aminotransferase